MKRLVTPVIVALVITFFLAGCKNDSATFSNSDGDFVLSPNGTYTQTFPQDTTQTKNDNPLDAAPNSGSWTLLEPTDGPGNSWFQIELSGVRRCNSRSLADSYTLVVGAGSIHGFDHLLGKPEMKSRSSTP